MQTSLPFENLSSLTLNSAMIQMHHLFLQISYTSSRGSAKQKSKVQDLAANQDYTAWVEQLATGSISLAVLQTTNSSHISYLKLH